MMLKANRVSTMIFIVTVLLTAIGGCSREEAMIPDSPLFPKQPFASGLTGKLFDRVNLIKSVVADTLTEIIPGVKQSTINYLDYAGKPMRLFILEVDLKNPQVRLKAGTPNNRTQYSRQVVSDIARTQDTAGNRVVAAVNGDYFAVSGEPQSIFFKNGIAVKPLFRLCALCTFLSVNNDGVPAIVSKDRTVDSTKIREAVGGFHYLIKDSLRVTQGEPSIEPRTAVGVTSNRVVYFIVVDGRQADYSNGMSFAQLSEVFFALGVKDAINMDGGGSTTLVVKEGSDWKVRNKPSDGTQRPVANAWTIVSTQ
ncbi:MAG: phosphodiester glycosidase family protein [Chitinophagaceae bacterium]